MPIYEFRCPSCGQTFELRRPLSRASDTAACPDCQTESERILSRVARVSRGGAEGDPGDDDAMPPMADDFGGGHGHSHGPMGHGH